MSFWGRIFEGAAGLFSGTTLCGLLATIVGRPRTDEDATHSVVFTIGVIALAAKIAKADGVVSPSEVATFDRLFCFDAEDHKHVRYVFDLARRDTAGYETYARQVAALFGDRHPVLEELLECLFQIAESDGELHPREVAYLATVADIFGFQPVDFQRMLAAHRATLGDECDPYHVLGVPPGADAEQIRVAYRRLVREHHPDRLIAAGMPKELIEQATQRMAAINAAYDRIVKQPLQA